MVNGYTRISRPESVDITGLLQRRDTSAVNQLIDWYRPLLLALADRNLDQQVRRRIEPSDIVQEACGEVASRIHRIDSKNRLQFWSYLKSAILNKVRDARRRCIIAEKRAITREEQPGETLENWIDQNIDKPLDVLILDETGRQVFAAFNRLPRELQHVLRWRFRKALTYREIGLRVDRTEDDVRMLINRCLARLRKEVLADVSWG